MSRMLVILLSLGLTACAWAETATNAAISSPGLDMAIVDKMSGPAFESLVCTLLKHQCYKIGNLHESNDYGVDMVASKDEERLAVQVQHSKEKIPRKAISDAMGGMKYFKCTKSMVVTNNEFTEDACELARGNDCILVDRVVLQRWLDSFKQARVVVLP